MAETILGVLFVILMAMVLVWFVLVSSLFRILRERHAAIYRDMGSPTLFLNNSIQNNWLFLKFLWSGDWRSLADSELERLCSVMRVFFVVYLVVFFGMMFSFFFVSAR